jgi:hypothetical protein
VAISTNVSVVHSKGARTTFAAIQDSCQDSLPRHNAKATLRKSIMWHFPVETETLSKMASTIGRAPAIACIAVIGKQVSCFNSLSQIPT